MFLPQVPPCSSPKFSTFPFCVVSEKFLWLSLFSLLVVRVLLIVVLLFLLLMITTRDYNLYLCTIHRASPVARLDQKWHLELKWEKFVFSSQSSSFCISILIFNDRIFLRSNRNWMSIWNSRIIVSVWRTRYWYGEMNIWVKDEVW